MLPTHAVRALLLGKSSELDKLFQRPSCSLSTIVVAEIRFGICRRQASETLRAIVEVFLETIEIQPWNEACASTYGTLRAELEHRGTPLAAMDLLIASHALARGCALVSTDQAFRQVPELTVMGW